MIRLNTPDDVNKYNLSFTRKEDGRKFLGRHILSGDSRVYDTEEHTFWTLTEAHLRDVFKSDPLNKKRNNRWERRK